MIWEDESEFPDIFDVEHFKKTLRADIRVVSSLPSSHLIAKQTIVTQMPYGVSPFCIHAKFFKQLNQEGVLVLKGLDSKLSKNLPSDLVRREMLARDGELSPFLNSSSALSGIDYIVSLNSDIFIPSHEGNMGRALQGHRAYMGHRKSIRPNKRTMVRFMEDSSMTEGEVSSIMRLLHNKSMKPEPRKKERDRDVIAYPVPEFMCRHGSGIF